MIHVPIQFLELLIQQSEGCLDHFHGLISNCTEVSVNKHLPDGKLSRVIISVRILHALTSISTTWTTTTTSITPHCTTTTATTTLDTVQLLLLLVQLLLPNLLLLSSTAAATATPSVIYVAIPTTPAPAPPTSTATYAITSTDSTTSYATAKTTAISLLLLSLHYNCHCYFCYPHFPLQLLLLLEHSLFGVLAEFSFGALPHVNEISCLPLQNCWYQNYTQRMCFRNRKTYWSISFWRFSISLKIYCLLYYKYQLWYIHLVSITCALVAVVFGWLDGASLNS